MKRKLMIYFMNSQDKEPVAYSLKILMRRAVEATLEYEGYANDAQVSVTFTDNEGIRAESMIEYCGESRACESFGNGRLDAVSNAVKSVVGLDYSLETYNQHALEGKTTAKAASYVSIKYSGKLYWGTGVDSDIIVSSVKALVSAVNRMLEDLK